MDWGLIESAIQSPSLLSKIASSLPHSGSASSLHMICAISATGFGLVMYIDIPRFHQDPYIIIDTATFSYSRRIFRRRRPTPMETAPVHWLLNMHPAIN